MSANPRWWEEDAETWRTRRAREALEDAADRMRLESAFGTEVKRSACVQLAREARAMLRRFDAAVRQKGPVLPHPEGKT